MMKAIVVSENGGTEQMKLTEVEIPTLKNKEGLVKNLYCGMNLIDTYNRTGGYYIDFPGILGVEGSGVIEKLGPDLLASGSTEFQIGDKVAYNSAKSYATFTVVDEDKLTRVPEKVPMDIAVEAVVQGLTAIILAEKIANVQPHHWVLIHSAAGGVGSLMVQMCHSIGAKIIAIVSSKEKSDLVKNMGAEY